jgi:hypothetical protein
MKIMNNKIPSDFWSDTRISARNIVSAIKREISRRIAPKGYWYLRDQKREESENIIIAMLMLLEDAINTDDPLWAKQLMEEIESYDKWLLTDDLRAILKNEIEQWYFSFPDCRSDVMKHTSV